MTNMTRPVLLLHGGGGPFTMGPIAAHLDGALLPTHPGWNGTPLGDVTSPADLAAGYLDLLRSQDLRDVLVIGSSLGGWIGVELALQDTENRVSALVVIDGAGVEIEGEPMRDFFALSPREVSDYSFHDGAAFFVDPATLPPEQLAARIANMQSMRAIAGDPYMHDPTLLSRLPLVVVPTLVIWGESDRIFTPGYGRAYAASIPGSRFELVQRAGHLPQLEQPEATLALIDSML